MLYKLNTKQKMYDHLANLIIMGIKAKNTTTDQEFTEISKSKCSFIYEELKMVLDNCDFSTIHGNWEIKYKTVKILMYGSRRGKIQIEHYKTNDAQLYLPYYRKTFTFVDPVKAMEKICNLIWEGN